MLTDEAYWRGRLAPDSRTAVQVVDSLDGDGRPLVTVTMTETVDSASFPALCARQFAVRCVCSVSTRGVLSATAGPSGRVEGTSTGMPVVIRGDYDLGPHAGGALLAVRGTITAEVPVIGGSIETLARQMVGQMVIRDRDEVLRRLTDTG